jgi:hypothetical protein
MTSKAFGLANLGNAYSDGALSNRNLIINGGLTVWQRGTSFAAGGGIVYTADRFWRYGGTSGNIERSTDAPTGFAYSLYGNTTSNFSGGTTVEIANNGGRSGYFPQQKYVYSFYLKGNFSSTYLAVSFRNATGTGTDEVPIITFSLGNGNGFGNYSDWTRVEKVIDTTGFTPHVNNLILDLEFGNFPAGGKAAGFQLEVGDTATPFEHRSYGQELALCQRYFTSLEKGATGPFSHIPTGIMGVYNDTTQGLVRYFFPTEMRAAPSMSYSALSDFDIEPFDVAPLAVSSGGGTSKALALEVTDPGARTRGFAFMLTVDQDAGYIRFDAEL